MANQNSGKVVGIFLVFETSTLTLNELWERNCPLFGGECWWKDEPFANERGKVGVIILRASAVPDSFCRTWDEQETLLSEEEEYVPAVRDLVEAMILCYRETGQRLFPGHSVRSGNLTSNGKRVDVGFFGNHIEVNCYWDDLRRADLGLAAARR